MTAAVQMRMMDGEMTDLETVMEPDLRRNQPLIVGVPGFGHLVAEPQKSNEPIVRLGEPTLLVALAQPDGDGHPVLHPREAKAVEDGWEVELLPNPSGEDRLVVCIPTAAFDRSET